MRHPNSLTPEETVKLKAILARCPDIEATVGHVRAFTEMMNTRTGHQFPDWIDKVKAAGPPELLSLVIGVVGDQRVVAAGLTLPFSSERWRGR